MLSVDVADTGVTMLVQSVDVVGTMSVDQVGTGTASRPSGYLGA